MTSSIIIDINEDYRKLQLASVTGYSGTTEWEILKITSWLVMATFFCNCFLPRSSSSRSIISQLLLEFIILIVPQIVLFCFPQYSRWMMISSLIPCVFYLVGHQGVDHKVSIQSPHRIPLVANLRSAIMIMCVIGILAVDFPLFPRRFVKTETFGTSLMDVGVGCVIVSMGITASRRLDFSSKGHHYPTFWQTIKSTLPLLILAIIRMFFVKKLDYQEHISEYGIHWNFFITLGLLPLLTWVIFLVIPPRWSLIVGSSLAVIYQLALQLGPLQAFALSETPRTTLLTMNKEGIVSLIGCFALFLMSVGCGYQFYNLSLNLRKLAQNLITQIIALGFIYFFLKFGLEIEASRRLMNLPFMVGSLLLTLIQTLGFVLIEWKMASGEAPLIAEATSENQLSFFLLVLTR